jgi:hypothetical protein
MKIGDVKIPYRTVPLTKYLVSSSCVSQGAMCGIICGSTVIMGFKEKGT